MKTCVVLVVVVTILQVSVLPSAFFVSAGTLPVPHVSEIEIDPIDTDIETMISKVLRKQAMQGSVCGGVLSSSAGVINYKFEEEYELDERCIWIIQSDFLEINLHLIAAGFDSQGLITVYRVDSTGELVPLQTYTESQPHIDSFRGTVLVVVFTSAVDVLTPAPVTTTPEPTTTEEWGWSTDWTIRPTREWTTTPWRTTEDEWSTYWTEPDTAATEFTRPEPSTTTTPRGKGFILSFNGVPDSPETPTTTYDLHYLDAEKGAFEYPNSSGSSYPGDSFVLIVLNPPRGYPYRLALTVHEVFIPFSAGENFCGQDALTVVGPHVGKFEPRLRYCTADPLSQATISSPSQLLVIFKAVNQELDGRGGFELSWDNVYGPLH